MRSLIAKEFRQNHLLVWLGFLMSAMIAALYYAWMRTHVETVRDQRDLDEFCGIILLLTTGVVVLVSTAGLFSIETTRGTLPFLLGLPVSRARIWLAKGLAGLAIAISSALLLIVPIAIVLPQVVREIHIWLYLPDIVVGVLLLFSVAFFCTTVFQRPISVLLVTVIMLAVVLIGETAFLSSAGPILGYDDLSDATLMSLFLVPAFLLASLFTFSRGELLATRRKWGLAVFGLLALIAFVLLAITGATRWAYRYSRAGVRGVDATSFPPHGAALQFSAYGSPAPFQRDAARGWVKEEGPYRSRHTVMLDLKTARELMVFPLRGWNRQADVAVSPDGRHLVEKNPGWFGMNSERMAIWDLRSRRRIYDGMPARSRNAVLGRGSETSWSPSGDWLVVPILSLGAPVQVPDRPGQMGRPRQRYGLLLMRPDGSRHVELDLWEEPEVFSPGQWSKDKQRWIVGWAWAPDGSALYTLTGGGLVSRVAVPGRETEKVWSGPAPGVVLPAGYLWRFSRLSVSPDGRWLEIPAHASPPYRESPAVSGDAEQLAAPPLPEAAIVVSAGGSRAFTIAARQFPSAIWSPDGRVLYLVDTTDNKLVIYCWRAGDDKAVPVAAPPKTPVVKVEALRSGSLLIWGNDRTYLVDEQGRFTVPRNEQMRSLPEDHELIGVDDQGRLILRSFKPSNQLSACDFSTGKFAKLYP